MLQDRLFENKDFVPDLASYDVILVSSSAGKDSQALLDRVARLARAAGVEERVTVAHADLKDMEWPETAELAAEHARSYGLRFELVAKEGPDLLDSVEKRNMWPDAARRWCTSSFKRQPILKLITALCEEARPRRRRARGKKRPNAPAPPPVRVLSCMGMRAAESPARAKKESLYRDERASSGRRTIDVWLTIFAWSDDEVWDRVSGCGTRVHSAYSKNLSRASCCLCVLSSKKDLVTAAKLRPELARRYAAVEQKTGHSFRKDLSMKEILDLAGVDQPPASRHDPGADPATSEPPAIPEEKRANREPAPPDHALVLPIGSV